MSLTPPLPDPDGLDRAASDLVDGRADASTTSLGPAEQEDLARRVERLRRVTRALGQEVQQPDTHVRDEQIARAVAEGRARATQSGAPPTPVRPIRDGQRVWPRRHRGILAAAAAVVALVTAILVVQRVAADHGSRASRAAIAIAPGAQATPGGPLAAGPASAGTPFGQLADLGSATDADQLAAMVADRLAGPAPPVSARTPTPGAATADGSTAGPSCQAPLRAAHPDLGNLRLAARATLAGQPVEVLVFAPTTPGQPARLFAASATTCTVLVDRAA